MGPRILSAGYAVLLGVALLVLLADQVSKALVASHIQADAPVAVLGGIVHLDYARNTGAAFSMLPNGGVLFEVVAIAVCAGILVLFPRLAGSSLPGAAALGLILGGASGNLVDRVRLGYVVDFVDLRWWPVFNLADCAVVTGACLLALFSLLRHETA